MQMNFVNMATALGWWDDLNMHGRGHAKTERKAGISRIMQRDLSFGMLVCLPCAICKTRAKRVG